MAANLDFDIPSEPVEAPPESLAEAEAPEPEVEVEAAESETEEIEASAEPESEPEPEQPSRANQRIQQEISRRKELEAQIQRMEQRFNEFQQNIAAKAAPEPDPTPDYEEDPAAHLLYKQQQLEKEVKEQQTWAQQQQKLAQVQQVYAQQLNDFESRQKDARPAFDYLLDSRQKELTAFGYSPDQVNSMINYEAEALKLHAVENGLNAAESFYKLAVARGYSSKPQAPAAASNIEQLAENVPRASSLGSRGQKSKKFSEMSLAEISNLDEEEYEKFEASGGWKSLAKRMQ